MLYLIYLVDVVVCELEVKLDFCVVEGVVRASLLGVDIRTPTAFTITQPDQATSVAEKIIAKHISSLKIIELIRNRFISDGENCYGDKAYQISDISEPLITTSWYYDQGVTF